MRRDRVEEGCGHDVALAYDPDVLWLVDDTQRCEACATRDMFLRKRHAEHENDPEIPGRPRWDEGRRVSVRPATEAEKAAAIAGKAPSYRRN